MEQATPSSKCDDLIPLDLLREELLKNLGRDGKETVGQFFRGPALFLKAEMQGMVYCGKSWLDWFMRYHTAVM